MFFNKNKSVWNDIFKDFPDKKYSAEMVEMLSSDNIDPDKFIANLKVMRAGSVEIFEISMDLHPEDKSFKGKNTKTIDKFTFAFDRPAGYYDWFVAAYPDVVDWAY